ncbi:MAG: hypothetical protein Q9195_006181 [Heterodermia aff. obscurata]
MEALVALSLASNIFQVLGFSVTIVQSCKQIREKGQAASNEDVSWTARQLSQTTATLATNIEALTRQRTADQEEQELLSHARSIQNISIELQEALAKFRLDGSKGRAAVFIKAVQSAWYAKKIEGLSRRLHLRQAAFDTLLLTTGSLRQRAIQVQQQLGFDALSDTLKSFIKSSADGQRAITELVANQGAKTRAFVNAESHQIREQLHAWRDVRSEEAAQQRLLESLRYEDMNLRQNQIEERYDETFEWIFSQESNHPPCSLPQWLKEGEGMYWVSGKPGSGKSTFMKFLCDDPRTRQLLQFWCDQTMILSYFIWKSGSIGQRSSKGLLTSLLYQLLGKNMQMSHRLFNDFPALKMKHTNADWSTKEATEVLFLALTVADKPLCLLLDGLDEFDEDEDFNEILKTIDRLVMNKSGAPVKVCISSRPEPELKCKLNRFPSLRLQDLTRRDIELYANNVLQEAPANKRNDLIEFIVNRADGVFLWVHYALRSLRRGLMKHDDWEELMTRLKALPNKIEALYHTMWLRLNEDEKIYREEAARFFHVAIELTNASLDLSLFNFMVASDLCLQECFIEWKPQVSAEAMINKFRWLEQRIPPCCAGLLEIEDDLDSDMEKSVGMDSACNGKNPASLERLSSRRVVFIHRSAKDFLTDTIGGRDILRHSIPSCGNWQALPLRIKLVAALAGLKAFTWQVAENELLKALNDKSLNSSEDIYKILSFMHRVCQRLFSSVPFDDVSNSWRGLRVFCYRDFLGMTVSHGVSTYLRQVFGRINKAFRIRPAYLNYLLICSSVPYKPINYKSICFLLHEGADPKARGFFYSDFVHPFEILKCAIDPLAAFLIGTTPSCGSFTARSRVPEIKQSGEFRDADDFMDTIKCFLTYGLDVSKKILINLYQGQITHPAFPIRVVEWPPSPVLLYETTVGDVINYTKSRLCHMALEEFPACQDYSKARRIILIASKNAYEICPDKEISNNEDARILSEKLNVYLSALSRSTFRGSSKERDLQRPEWRSLCECIEAVYNSDSSSKLVDGELKLIQMGYLEKPHPTDDYLIPEPFEKKPGCEAEWAGTIPELEQFGRDTIDRLRWWDPVFGKRT